MSEMPLQGASEQIQAALAVLSDRINERELSARKQIKANQGLTGPCPTCTESQPLDEEATLQESTERGEFRPVFTTCEACKVSEYEAKKMLGYGVPSRVTHATFQNYEIRQPEQALVVSAVKEWINDPEKVFLFLLGSCGAGKGHLAASVVRSTWSRTLWTTHHQLITQYHSTEFSRKPAFLQDRANYPLLVIDEMGGKSPTTDTPEIFYEILDKRHDTKRKTILIGNIPYESKDSSKSCILNLIGRDRMESRVAQSGTIITCAFEDYRKLRK